MLLETGSPTFPGYKNAFSDIRGPERGEQTMIPAFHTGDGNATRRLRPKRNSYSLLRRLVPCSSQPEDPAGDLSTDTFSEAVSRFTAVHHWASGECEHSLKRLCLAKEVLVRQSAKAAIDAGTEASLSGDGAKAAEVVTELMLETDVKRLPIADKYPCEVAVASSKITHPSTGLSSFARERFKLVMTFGSYYRTVFYCDLSPGQPKKRI